MDTTAHPTPRGRRRSTRLAIATAAILGIAVLGLTPTGGASAQAGGSGPGAAVADALARLRAASGGPVTSVSGRHGLRYVAAAPGRALTSTGSSPAATARSFAADLAPALGATGSDTETIGVEDAPAGDAVRLQQTIAGLPVFGGQIAVQLDESGAVRSAVADVSSASVATTSPSISAASARKVAVGATASREGVRPAGLVAGEPVLSIYDPAVLGLDNGRTHLVWNVPVRATTDSVPIQEIVLVDAGDGTVPLLFNQIAYAKDREVCDDNNVAKAADHCTKATAVRHEGGAANADAEVNTAYQYAGDTYDFYASRFGRDSLDGKGMTLYSTVQYCDPSETCPYQNAFWSGAQMHYGSGFASADDVVGHELSHGVTTFTSNLYYYYQSGAINEALSDIFGEYIDQTNGSGTDTAAVRWQLGEDLPASIGVIRNMADPTIYGDPDRMTSANYVNSPSDAGGVHTDSGVANKAAFLMTDGATFNGQTITGIGLTKAAAVWYRVEAAYLLSASDYADLGVALNGACADLVGGPQGITTSDCTQVSKAVLATEMAQQPPASSVTAQAPVCTTGTPSYLFHDDLENSSSGNWTATNTGAATKWYYPQNSHPYAGFDATYATSGTKNFFGDVVGGTGDGQITKTTAVVLPAGTSYLRFNRSYDFEYSGSNYYDGAVVEYSTTNGASWTDAGSLFTHGGYTGTIRSGTTNPLAGRSGFIKASNGYGSSRLDLTSLAGQSVKFRFRLGSDSSASSYGMFVDDIDLYTCSTAVGTVSGVVRDGSSNPVRGAVVTIGGRSASTDGSGAYTLTGLTPGSTTATTSAICRAAVNSPVTVTANTTTTLNVSVGAFGNCQVDGASWETAGTALALTGDNNSQAVALPFTFTHFGQARTTAYVSTNGYVSFQAASSVAANTALPSAAAPNDAIYAFWDDLAADGSSSIRTGTAGTAPNRRFVIEWQNVYLVAEPTRRLSFQVVLYEDPNQRTRIQYAGIASGTAETGSSATVGRENAAGDGATQVSFNTGLLFDGLSVRPK